jgi:hypothetical protein
MSNALHRAREMSLALLVIAVIDNGFLNVDYSGATPNSSGLVRLGRDLMRRATSDPAAEIMAPQRRFSRKMFGSTQRDGRG